VAAGFADFCDSVPKFSCVWTTGNQVSDFTLGADIYGKNSIGHQNGVSARIVLNMEKLPYFGRIPSLKLP